MKRKARVVELHRQYPLWTADDIAERLECTSAYVRATARRNGLVLPVRYPALRAAQLQIQAHRREMRR